MYSLAIVSSSRNIKISLAHGRCPVFLIHLLICIPVDKAFSQLEGVDKQSASALWCRQIGHQAKKKKALSFREAGTKRYVFCNNSYMRHLLVCKSGCGLRGHYSKSSYLCPLNKINVHSVHGWEGKMEKNTTTNFPAGHLIHALRFPPSLKSADRKLQ